MLPMFMPAYDTEIKDGKPIDVVRVVVNNGHLSVDNGALGACSLFFELAKLTGLPPEMGDHYGQDCLLVPASDWPTVEALLQESKLLYRLAGRDQPWQNILTDAVRARLAD